MTDEDTTVISPENLSPSEEQNGLDLQDVNPSRPQSVMDSPASEARRDQNENKKGFESLEKNKEEKNAQPSASMKTEDGKVHVESGDDLLALEGAEVQSDSTPPIFNLDSSTSKDSPNQNVATGELISLATDDDQSELKSKDQDETPLLNDLDSSIVQDDHFENYENKELGELSKGNKEYLMLVPTDDGDDGGEPDADDALDIEGKEFGYRGVMDLQGTSQSVESSLDTTAQTESPSDNVFEEKDVKDNGMARRVGVAYTNDESDTIRKSSQTGEITADVTSQLSSNSEITQVKITPIFRSESTSSASSQNALQQGEATRVGPQSNSTDNLRNIGYRDSVSSDTSLPDFPVNQAIPIRKLAPQVNGVPDNKPHEHSHPQAKVERRNTWGSWEFSGFFKSRNKQKTSVQRRSSMAARPVTKSASQADIMCGECDYCVSLPANHRLLQTQLDKTEKDYKKREDELHAELKTLKKENEKQQKLINQNLSLGPEAKIEATMQHEITRLTGENLDLRETIDKQSDQIRKLKKMLKVYSKKLKDGEAAEIQAELEREERSGENGALATVKHRQRIYLGMLEYKREDEGPLLKNLILDLKPKIASGLLPGLPAYILFMCVRHTDYTNDDEKVRSLLTGTINSLKKVVKKHSDDIERSTMWLANTCRILHTLKQYSGEKTFQTDNTAKQNEQCLRNFDLSEYRQVFSDLAVWIYQGLIKAMQERIQPSIVPAVLEHEAIAGLTASKPSGLRGRSMSNAHDMDEDASKMYSLDTLMREMNNYLKCVTQHAVDPELVKQIFRQLFYFLCAGALNNLLLRKDMCNWSKGMQIRYNISHLEQWLRDNKLHESGATVTLETIIQASQLLQARKTEADVDSVCEMCSKLTLAQIVKILNLYTPVDEFEERVPIAFIRKIQEKLKDRQGVNNTLLMDTKFSFPVTFPFNPSSIAMETIEVPEQLHLGFLKRI